MSGDRGRIDRTMGAIRGRLRGPVHPTSVTIDPARTITAADAGRAPGARWQVVRPAESPHRTPPRQFGTRPGDFEAAFMDVPDLGVLWLEQAAIVNLFGLVVTRQGDLVLDTSTFRRRADQVPLDRRSGIIKPLSGTLISIATDHAYRNYGHFLLDALPRIALLEGAGVSLGDADHILCGTPGPSTDRLLEALGVDPARRLRPKAGVAFQAERSIVTSIPGTPSAYLPWIVTFLRERLSIPARTSGRRLYLPRGGHRRILNESELLPILDEHGFEVYRPGTTDEDPRQVFAEASVVVGGHGAGLTDIVFCPPGAAVLELMPHIHVRAYYWTLAAGAGLDYGYLIGPAVEPEPGTSTAKWDYTIDPDEFRVALEATLA